MVLKVIFISNTDSLYYAFSLAYYPHNQRFSAHFTVLSHELFMLALHCIAFYLLMELRMLVF